MPAPRRNADTGIAGNAIEDRTLAITRTFDAPRELVFAVFTRPEHLLRWMGPRHAPITRMETDLRPGGRWRGCLPRAEDNAELWFGGIYHEIEPPERLAFTFAWEKEGKPGHETLVTVTFEEQEGRTLMNFRQQVFDTIESRNDHRDGWTSCFDRLEEFLANR